MSPLDVSGAIPIDTAREFADWLTDHGSSARELNIAIFKKSSGRQTDVRLRARVNLSFAAAAADRELASRVARKGHELTLRFGMRGNASYMLGNAAELAIRTSGAERRALSSSFVMPDTRPGSVHVEEPTLRASSD